MQRSLLLGLTVSIAIFSGVPSRTAEVVQAQDGITAESMGAHIAQIEGARHALGTQGERTKLGEVAGYIHTQLDTFGLSVEEDPVTYSGQTFPNVIGVLSGTVCPDTSFIVGAHYDSVGASPGADDNGSGVAAMLEIARVLSSESFQPSIEFVGFSFEEDGLVGSRQMATQAGATGEDIAGVLVFDMIGYTCDEPGCQTYPPGLPGPDVGNFIAAVGNTASAPLLQTFTEASASAVPALPVSPLEVPGNGETFPSARRSDHAPFWDQGYRSLMVTDTANYRNPNYHHPSDTLSTLNLSFAADVANASLAAVIAAATADHDADGVADACDNCPLDPDNDIDGDGICGGVDNCPAVSNPDQLNTDSACMPNGADIAGDCRANPDQDPLGDACDTDRDNDGLTDAEEATGCGFGPTDPLNKDTDGDRAIDGYECRMATDPNNPADRPQCTDPTDTDGDGITNCVEELGYGTSPMSMDTEGDSSGNDGCQDDKEIVDMNGDRQANILDVVAVARIGLVADSYDPVSAAVADINKDGADNILDVLVAARNSTLVEDHAACQ